MVTTVSLKDALFDGAREVFETMVFMALEPPTEPGPEIADEALLGTITFKGNLEGCLGVCCSPRCARAIAANMLGMDSMESVSEEDVNDAIGEVANMVMGAVKGRVQGDVGVIEVSIPSVVQGRQLRNSLGDKANKITVQGGMDSHIVEFSLLYRESTN
jgi:chemotaxis protein CheX